MQRHGGVVAALAAAAAVALLAVVTLSAQQQGAGATALASLRTAGTWPAAAPEYEPQVGDVLSKVRDFHPRRPRGRVRATVAAGADGEPPLVTAHTEREVTARRVRARRAGDAAAPRNGVNAAAMARALHAGGIGRHACVRGGCG